VCTNDDDLADQIRISREYGNRGDYNSLVPGLNARMQEFSALLGIEGLKQLEGVAERRNEIAALYREALGILPGITFQHINPRGRSAFKDFTILIDENLFGVKRDCVAWALRAEGAETRNYYDPPVHLQEAYRAFRSFCDGRLSLTERISKKCLSLPIGAHLKQQDILRIASAFERIHRHAKAVKSQFVTTGCALSAT